MDDENILLCDFGGTHARLGVLKADGEIRNRKKYKCADFDTHKDVLSAYTDEIGLDLSNAGIAATHGHIHGHHHPFKQDSKIDKEQLEAAGFEQAIVINDFEASAHGALWYPEPKMLYHGHPSIDEKTTAFIGPGTGLGCAYLYHTFDPPYVQVTYGAHMLPAAATEEQHEIICQLAGTQDTAVIYEDIASGRGLEKLYTLFTGNKLDTPRTLFDDPDNETHARILRLFHEFFGLYIQNVMVTSHAFRSVILHGGLLDRLQEAGLFDFETVHNMMQQAYVPVVSAAVANTPVMVIEDTYLALDGLKYLIERERLKNHM